MLGIFANETATIKRIFSAHGITKAGFVAELKKVKTGPVTSDNPEDTYDALKKYGTDLVERAREGKMDPVIGRDQEIRNSVWTLPLLAIANWAILSKLQKHAWPRLLFCERTSLIMPGHARSMMPTAKPGIVRDFWTPTGKKSRCIRPQKLLLMKPD